MRLTYNDYSHCYIARPDVRGDDEAARLAGFTYDKQYRQWITLSAVVASRLIDFADNAARTRLEPILRAGELSLAKDAQIDIPAPPGCSYLPFQRAGIAAMLQRHKTLLADEMGTGKSVQALGLINLDTSIKRVLVICPASIKLNWAREARKWLTRKFNIAVLMPRDAGLFAFRDGDFLIVNYDILDRFDVLAIAEIDLLICDESHALKNAATKRSKLVAEIRAKREVFLTGTPIPNRVGELWPIADRLAGWSQHDPYAHGRFSQKFCQWDRFKWDDYPVTSPYRIHQEAKRNRAMAGLQDLLRKTIMIRRLKADVLPELPPKFRQVIELDPGSAKAIVRNEVQFYDNWQAQLDKLRTEVAAAKTRNEDEYKDAIKALNDTVSAGMAEMGKLRHMTALAKVPHVIKRLKELIEEDGQRIVCFAHHRDVVSQIADAFDGCAVRITGETSQSDRQLAVDQFQTLDRVKLFVGSLYAAGEGITLTAAKTAVFAEGDWVPAKIVQAEDRLARIGQRNSVLCQFLVFDESLDARMAKIALHKLELSDRALNAQADA